ncbi:nucleoside hydrolase [Patescibacteria group bacterium]|nr:MAG: nucleoside hydrolase [Patescibacteria group bacterium]
MRKRRIIIDTDPGHDDALAIILLEKSGLFDVRAITTVAGNSTIENTTNNARYILDLLDSVTPIFSGAAAPLQRELIRADVHGESGLAGADIKKSEPLSGNAADKIVEIVKTYPGEITILALGPLTNLARAFQKDETIVPMIQEVVMMGGAIAVPGNKNRVAEFNIFVDPDAANIVFRAAVPKVLMPLDVCNHIFFTLKKFDELKNTNLYKPIKDMMIHYIQGVLRFEKIEAAIMYDPLAAYYLINSNAFTAELMDVQVETQSELTRGMTVADRRIWGEKHPNVTVVLSADRNLFIRDFLKILKRD